MAVETIEQFIERSRLNCRQAAEITVKQRYADSTGRQYHELPAEETAEYLASPEGVSAVEKALGSQRFYRALMSADPADSPRVKAAYRKYVYSVTGKTMEEDKPPQPEKKPEKKKAPKKNMSAAARKAGYLYEYRNYEITASDEAEIIEQASERIRAYYSDLRKFLPYKYIREIYSEFVSDQFLSKFRRRMYDEAALNPRRIDAAVSGSDMLYHNLNEYINGWVILKILGDSGYSELNKRRYIRDFLSGYSPRYRRLRELYALIAKKLDRETVSAIISGGEEYARAMRHMKSQIEISETAHELILKEIPDNVIDLYPGARNMRRHFVLHLGPTNSGKTYNALLACKAAETGIYLAPLRLLAYEICEKFNIEGVPCDMRTGEESIEVPFAKHTASTVEMLNTNEHYDVAVVDECQLIEDEERGGAWTAAILGLMADEIHLCAAENAEDLLITLIDMCSDSYEIVRHERSVPLVCDDRRFVFPKSVEPNDALIVFSKRSVLSYAEQLKMIGIKTSVIYGDLPYDVRRSEVARFIKGETDVVVATDAVGMGLNLPIKRVVFLESYKYDGRRRRFLHGTEIKQIAGRAGRMGMYDIGYFNAAEFKDDIKRKLKKKSHDVKRARLRIPESIISVDMPVSEILLRWGTIPDDDLFLKNSVEREVALARDLEKHTEDKYLIYRFITIPFSETRRELYEFWFELFEREVGNDRRSVYFYIRTLERRGDTLEDHELAYRKCDILYFYYDRFGIKEDLEAIMELKHAISADIMEILSDRNNV